MQKEAASLSVSSLAARAVSTLEPRVKSAPVRRRCRELFVSVEAPRFLPCASYPCPGGLSNLEFYKPGLVLLSRHAEWEPSERPCHRVLHSSIVRRESSVGTLYDRHRQLEKVFRQVASENAALFGEIERLRNMVEEGGVSKGALEREMELRRIAEIDRDAALRAKEEAEEEAARVREQVMQLQGMLHQAVEYQQKGGNSAHYAYQRVGV